GVGLGGMRKGTYRMGGGRTVRDRVLASTGRDPLRFTRCGGEMMFWKVWHPRYGVIYNELHEIKRGRYRPRRGIPPDAKANGDGEKPLIQLALTGLWV